MKKILILILLIITLVGCNSEVKPKTDLEIYNEKVDLSLYEFVDGYYSTGFGMSDNSGSIYKITKEVKEYYIPYIVYLNKYKNERIICVIEHAAFINNDVVETIFFYKDAIYKEHREFVVEKYAFYDCNNLTTLVNPNFKDVLAYAFYNTNLNIKELTLRKADNYSFAEIKGQLGTVNFKKISDYNIEIGTNAFKNTKVNKIYLDKEINYLGKNCFAGILGECEIIFNGSSAELLECFAKAINEKLYDPLAIGVDNIRTSDGIISVKELLENEN